MDEDIKIVEELICQKYSERLLNTLSMAKEEDEIYILTIHERQAIENLLSRLKTAERMNDELIKLRTALQKEYNCAMEGFMKKQISTSVVDGTIAQETGWILNELDKILGNGQERR